MNAIMNILAIIAVVVVGSFALKLIWKFIKWLCQGVYKLIVFMVVVVLLIQFAQIFF